MSVSLREENKMAVRPVFPLLMSMAIPPMISMLIQSLYNIVDSMFVAKIGEDALTAVSLAFPVQTLIVACSVGIGVGVNSYISRSLGREDQEGADSAVAHGLLMAAFVAVLFIIAGQFLLEPFFRLFSDDPAILADAITYTNICLTFCAGSFIHICIEKVFQSTGSMIFPMLLQALGAITNIILDPIMIFGLFGFPRMEVAGAALATVTGQIVAAIVGLIVNIKCNHDIHIHRKNIRWDPIVAKEIYRVGIPSIIMQSISSVMTFGMNKILFVFTPTATAVFGAYFKIQSFVFMPIFGLNNGMVPIISYNYGAARPQRVWKTIRLSNITAMVIMVVGFTIFQLFPSTLLELFDASETMLAIGVPALRIISVSFLLAGFCIIAGSVFQAIGNPVYSLIVSVCRQMVVLLPVAWLLSRTGRLELVWWSFPIAEVMSFTLSTIFLRRTVKSANEVMNSSAD